MKSIINLINYENKKQIINHISRDDNPKEIRRKIKNAMVGNYNNISTEITPNFLKDNITLEEYEFFCQNFVYVINYDKSQKESNNKSKIIYIHDTKKSNSLIISEIIRKKEVNKKEFIIFNTNRNNIDEIDFSDTSKVYLDINTEKTNEDPILNKILFNEIELAVINADINLRIKLYLHGIIYHDIDFDDSKSIREFYKTFYTIKVEERCTINTDNLNAFLTSLRKNSDSVRKYFRSDARYYNIIKRCWKNEKYISFNRYERYFIARNIKFSGEYKRPIKSYFLSLLKSPRTSGWPQELEFFLENDLITRNIDLKRINISLSKSEQQSMVNTIIFYSFTSKVNSNFELLNDLIRYNICNTFTSKLILSFIKKKENIPALIENLDFINMYNKEFYSLFLLIFLKDKTIIDKWIEIPSVKKFLRNYLFEILDYLINCSYICIYDLIDLKNTLSVNLKIILNYLDIRKELELHKINNSISYRIINSIYVYFNIKQFTNKQLLNEKIIEMFFYHNYNDLSCDYSYLFQKRHLFNQSGKLILFTSMYKFLGEKDVYDNLLIFANELKNTIKISNEYDYVFSFAYFKFNKDIDMLEIIVSKFWISHFNFLDFEKLYFK